MCIGSMWDMCLKIFIKYENKINVGFVVPLNMFKPSSDILLTVSRQCFFLVPLYNHATSNLAIYFHKTSQDKPPEAYKRQSIIVIQVHDKLHEKLFISTCSFLCINESG